MTTRAMSQARCSAVRRSLSLTPSCSFLLWARSSSTASRSFSCTACRSCSPSGASAAGSGARNSRCSYLARIHDSRSSLRGQVASGDVWHQRDAWHGGTDAWHWGDPWHREGMHGTGGNMHGTGGTHTAWGYCCSPGRLRGGFAAALRVLLPDAVGGGVADGGEHQRQLPGPVVQVEGAHARQVGAQVAVDPRALDADQRPQVQAGPGGVWGGETQPRVTHGTAWPPAFLDKWLCMACSTARARTAHSLQRCVTASSPSQPETVTPRPTALHDQHHPMAPGPTCPMAPCAQWNPTSRDPQVTPCPVSLRAHVTPRPVAPPMATSPCAPRPPQHPPALTGRPAVHAEGIAAGVADGLDGHGLALAVHARLGTDSRVSGVGVGGREAPPHPPTPPLGPTLFLLLSQHCRLARIWLSMACTQASRSSKLLASKCHVCPVLDTMMNSKFSSSVGPETPRGRWDGAQPVRRDPPPGSTPPRGTPP
uniref:Uncharacterized protein n=1 Tax=Anser cygnoides TaxID=8845 RepID=A0A8B9DS93_ANSCY